MKGDSLVEAEKFEIIVISAARGLPFGTALANL
jgi:adenine/guanine phosphoribosyltransferase-like PRPP-binding protein